MERLDLLINPVNPAIEATIHVARYSNILPYVQNKVVLDAACGEGYGSALLMQAGARRVVGVDISSIAIEKAILTFSESGAEYLCADVSKLMSIFDTETFDVIVSIETIEHISDHEAFLQTLSKLGKRSTLFYLTCPNDYWYYPDNDQHNPYHLRKYSFEEFQEISQRHLGRNVKWGIGGPVLGFGTVPSDANESSNYLYKSWIQISQSSPGYFIANRDLSQLTQNNCSYFVGIWNLPEEARWAASIFPVSMEAYSRMAVALTSEPKTTVAASNDTESSEDFFKPQGRNSNNEQQSPQRDSRNSELLLAAAQAENIVLRENVARLQTSVAQMQTAYWRYVQVTKWIPVPIKKWIMKLVHLMKKNSK